MNETPSKSNDDIFEEGVTFPSLLRKKKHRDKYLRDMNKRKLIFGRNSDV